MRRAVFDEIHQYLFCFFVIILVIVELCQQIFGFCALYRAGVLAQLLQVGQCLFGFALRQISLGADITGFGLDFGRELRVFQEGVGCGERLFLLVGLQGTAHDANARSLFVFGTFGNLLQAFETFQCSRVVLLEVFNLSRAGNGLFHEARIVAADNSLEAAMRLVVVLLRESDATQIEVGVYAEGAFRIGLQIVLQAASCAVVVATQEQLLGGDVGERVLLVYLQVDVSAERVHVVGIGVDVVEVYIDGT